MFQKERVVEKMEINEEKRNKFIEYAGKRVNNVLHDMKILEPMARSNAYDFTKADVDEMFDAMQEALNDVKEEFYRKFEEKAKAEKKVFSFGASLKKEKETEHIETDVVEAQNSDDNNDDKSEIELMSESNVL